LPLKLCYVTNCYRYEAPQSGRYREFTQFGAEVFGADTPACDTELIAMAYDLFSRLGMPEDCYKIEINSIGCPDCRGNYQQKLRDYYTQFKDKLCGDCLQRLERNPMRLIDCKVPVCGGFKENAPVILDYNCDNCNAFFAKFKAGLELLGIPYTVNPKIVRGLDYYCNTVFEFVPETGPVFGGGGRYNGLVKELGGAAVPASGFALGIERIVAFINTFGKFPAVRTPDLYIASLGEKAVMFSQKLAQDLRKCGLHTEFDIVGRSVKAQMRYADKTGAKFSVVIGDTELETNTAVLKNMETKETHEVNLSCVNSVCEKLAE
jgi:histidyl-tRNA synthetase